MRNFKAEWLASQEAEWDSQIQRLKEVYLRHPEDTRGMMRHFDTIMDLFWVPTRAGGNLRKLAYSSDAYDLVGAMHFVASFVSHEIHDDGAPYLVWLAPDPQVLEKIQDKLERVQARIHTESVPVPQGHPLSRPVVVNNHWESFEGMQPITETGESSLLVQEALKVRAREIETNKKWAEFQNTEPSVREASPAQKFFSSLLEEWG